MKKERRWGRHRLMSVSMLATWSLFGCDDTSDAKIVDASVRLGMEGAVGSRVDGSVAGSDGISKR